MMLFTCRREVSDHFTRSFCARLTFLASLLSVFVVYLVFFRLRRSGLTLAAHPIHFEPLSIATATTTGTDNPEWTFDFASYARDHDTVSSSAGRVTNANTASFPPVVGNGMTMAWITLGPCGMLPPHWHPRASNYVVSIEGEDTHAWMVVEDESSATHTVHTRLRPGVMTVFPKGILHAMANAGMLITSLLF
jgi:hypothetical protein